MRLPKLEAVTRACCKHTGGKALGKFSAPCGVMRRQVDLHQQKLRSPEQFVKDWATKDARMQEGLLRHWREALARNQGLAEVMRGILQDRSIQP